MHRPFALVAILTCGVAAHLSAQRSIAGSWRTEFAAQVRIENGVMSTVKGHARIDVRVAGDSIHGTWQNLDTAGVAQGPAKALTGTITGDSAHFESVKPSEIVRREMDSETHTQVIMHYDVAVNGDSLVGTEHWVAVDHASQGPPRRFTATRKS